MQEYLGLFLDESRENLQALNASILDLEREPDNPGEALNTIFRAAHSLKGMSATMGFEEMAKLTHRMEEVLSALRDGAAPVTTAVTDVLFSCLDTLEGMVEDIGGGGEGSADTEGLLATLSAILSGDAAVVAQTAATTTVDAPAQDAEAPPADGDDAADDADAAVDGAVDVAPGSFEQVMVEEAIREGLTVRSVHVRLEESCVLRAARAYMVVQEVESLGEIVKSEPGTEAIEREDFDFEFTLWVATEYEDAHIVDVVTGVSEVAECEISDVVVDTAPAEAATPASDDAEVQAQVVSEPAEPVTPEAEASAEPAAPATSAPEPAPARERRQEPAGDSGGSKRAAQQTVRVGTDRLDSLMNLMGEMVIHRTRLTQLSADHDLGDLRQAVEELTRVTNDLQSLIMQVRMMPVEAVFMRFPRMVRDLANNLGKQL
ncbi:MAG: Hpt domain-containing protein, partial [Dehalococcoidia bacterium]|nr:Hpt domain-containing protein [Dehalococcoidia bacterium]